MSVSSELLSQWSNPADILSLLLLIGGQIVQTAIAQLFGFYVEPKRGSFRVYLTPVAFSFGWVGYAVLSLGCILGDKQLMPSSPDTQGTVINCDNGYARRNRSWLIGRLQRDHKMAVAADPGPQVTSLNEADNRLAMGLRPGGPPPHISMRFDIANLGVQARPKIDHVWVLGWVTIAFQLIVSIIPWILNGNWSVFAITLAGNLGALLTGSLRQWQHKKWPGRRLNESRVSDVEKQPFDVDIELGLLPTAPEVKPKHKDVCATRGNGHRNALILRGTDSAWDLETMATADSTPLPETWWCLLGLAIFWVCVLISVSGIESGTWYLILIGGVGMIQNVYAANTARKPECLGLPMTPYAPRPTILGIQLPVATSPSADLPLDQLQPWETAGVRGAILELEKTIPKAGGALMKEFFPPAWSPEQDPQVTAQERDFWKRLEIERAKERGRVVKGERAGEGERVGEGGSAA